MCYTHRMLIYLDTCSLQRPFDNQQQLSIRKETEAVLKLMMLCESGKLKLVSSDILWQEIAAISYERRDAIDYFLKNKFTFHASLTEEIQKQANIFREQGLKRKDAIHLASAVHSKTHYFCTSDIRFLNRAKQLDTKSTIILSPIECIEVLENDY